VSGGFWEERNAKVTKTIKTHVEWTVLDCDHMEKILHQGDKNPPPFFLERKERFRAEQRYLGIASCLFFTAAN
jgi:hypothetical protein